MAAEKEKAEVGIWRERKSSPQEAEKREVGESRNEVATLSQGP